jgi:hypothetical protein
LEGDENGMVAAVLELEAPKKEITKNDDHNDELLMEQPNFHIANN